MSEDWSKASEDAIREVVRSGEAYVRGQLSLATSADQRAAVMASIFTAAGAAIVGALILLAGSPPPAVAGSHAPIFIGGGIAAALFLTGAGLCALSAMPVGFFLPGTQPKNWYSDIREQRDWKAALGELAENYQEKIDDNRATLKRNARRFTGGAIAGIAAPVTGFLAWLVSAFCW